MATMRNAWRKVFAMNLTRNLIQGTSGGLRMSAAVLLTACGLAAGQAHPTETTPCAHEAGCEDLLGRPFFDIRQDEREFPTRQVAAALAKARASEAWKRREATLADLARRVPMLKCDDHHLFGTPHFLRSTVAFLTGPSQLPPREVVASFIDAYRDLFEITRKDLDDARIVRDFGTHGLMHHLTFQQTLGGLDLYGNILRTNVTSRGELINVSSLFLAEPAGGWQIPDPVLNAREALAIAAQDAGVTIQVEPLPGEAVGAEEKTTWTVGPEFDRWLPVTTRRVYFALTREEITPAFVVIVPVPGVGHTYETVIDAVTGTVLWRQNYLNWDITQPITFRIYDQDSPAPGSPGTPEPNGFQFPHVPRILTTVTPAMMAPYSPDGWIPDGGTQSVGNNVDAYLDSANDNTAQAADRATSATRVYDFTLNVDANNMPTDAPSVYRDAAISQAFYWTNEYHDRLWAMGFDEPAGNFQVDNFGRGGLGNDLVRMEVQDGSGTNNANFSTPADGSPGRCQMYIWTGPTPDRDGSLDSDVVFHELTHGTSSRCHEVTLTGTQARGMGEGWSDFFALSLNAEPTDDYNAIYAMGPYATYQLWGSGAYVQNYYFGIRRFPYSTDENRNPQTFADIDSAQESYPPSVPKNPYISDSATSVHNKGEVWCNSLIECRARIAIDEGNAANQIMMQVVLDGMKLAPSNPNFLQERDAILQGDLVRYAGSHQRRLWEGFAESGMGYSATSPVGGATAGLVEAFDTPTRVIFSFPDGIPTRLDPAAPTSFRVVMTPQFLTVTPGTQRLYVSVNGGAFTFLSMTGLGGDEYLATIPGAGCFDNVRFYIQTGTSEGTMTSPAGAPTQAYSALVFTGTVQALADDMESSTGWTVGPNTATTGVWERADPQGTAAQPEDDTTPAPGVNCWVTGAQAGTSVGSFDVDGGYTYLTSPVFDASGADYTISYMRWYNNNNAATYGDPWLVEISNNNGSTWTTFELIPTGSPNQPGWVQVSKTLSELGVTGTSQMRLRFKAEDQGTASIVEAAIDDFVVSRRVCEEPGCDPDVNCDGSNDGFDVEVMEQAVGGNMTNFCQADPDFNGDGSVDGFDVEAVEAVVGGSPCP
jgi:hypothetical protein